MSFLEEQKTALEKARQIPYFLETVEKIEAVKQAVAAKRKDHETQADNAYKEDSGLWSLAALAVGVVSLVGGMMTFGFPGYMGGVAIMFGGLVTAKAYSTSEPVKAAKKKEYLEKNEAEISNLKTFAEQLDVELDAKIGEFRNMTPQQQAGLVHYERLVHAIEPLRMALLDSFRGAVKPVEYEQVGVQNTSTPAQPPKMDGM